MVILGGGQCEESRQRRGGAATTVVAKGKGWRNEILAWQEQIYVKTWRNTLCSNCLSQGKSAFIVYEYQFKFFVWGVCLHIILICEHYFTKELVLDVWETILFPVNCKGCFLTEVDVVHITFTADYEIKINLSMISYCLLENRYSTETHHQKLL